jgi:porin
MANPTTPSSSPVKLVSAMRVREGGNDQFLEWNGRMADALLASPGFTNREVIPPQTEDIKEWIFITRFDSIEHLRAWRESDAHERLLGEVKPLLDGEGTELVGDAATQYHLESSVTEVILEQVAPGKNVANGTQTGLRGGPEFNEYGFNIVEAGGAWEIGRDNLPGAFGIGVWNQSGELRAGKVSESGAQGVYLFGSQRIWLRHPGQDSSGIASYIQFGANNSKTLPIDRYFGSGLTAFGLVPGRPRDSAGTGVAWSSLNQNLFKRDSELMFQAYYQAHLIAGTYLEPVISFIPTPGASPEHGAAWATTLRVTVLF